MVALKQSPGPPMFVRIITYPDVIRVAVRVNPPAARHNRTPVNTNTVCVPRRTSRRIVCSKSLRLKSGLTPDEVQRMYLLPFWVYSHCKHTTAVVTSRHNQCRAGTTVGTESTSTVAVATEADGRRYDPTASSVESHTSASVLVCSSS